MLVYCYPNSLSFGKNIAGFILLSLSLYPSLLLLSNLIEMMNLNMFPSENEIVKRSTLSSKS